MYYSEDSRGGIHTAKLVVVKMVTIYHQDAFYLIFAPVLLEVVGSNGSNLVVPCFICVRVTSTFVGVIAGGPRSNVYFANFEDFLFLMKVLIYFVLAFHFPWFEAIIYI